MEPGRVGLLIGLRSQGVEDFGLRAPEATGEFKPQCHCQICGFERFLWLLVALAWERHD